MSKKNTSIRIKGNSNSNSNSNSNYLKKPGDYFPDYHYAQNNWEYIATLNKYELCIVTYIATTYIETLYLNIPTVIYYDKNKYEFDDFMTPVINIMVERKIIHSSIESLYSHVNSIQDVQLWWNSPLIQDSVRMFRDFLPSPKSMYENYSKAISKGSW